MAEIEFENVTVEFPVYNASARSLKTQLLKAATGGNLEQDANGVVHIRALEDITFRASDGDRIGLVGHNGSGKSSLLRTLSGVYEPSQGQASVKGKLGSLIDVSIGIDSESTGIENIFLRGALLGLKKSQMKSHVQEIIDFSELGNFIQMPLRTYSAGMHLRLAFAISTIIRPEILLMDEWLSVGDESFKHKAEERLAEVVGSSKILVLASHSRDLLEATCNRVIWLEHGRVIEDGSPQEVCRQYFG